MRSRYAQLFGETARTKRPLFIAVSGYGDKASRLHSYEAGIDLHLVKPVDTAEVEGLLKRFRTVLGDGE